MSVNGLRDRIRLFVNRIRERLWAKPLAMCVLSIAGVFAARAADGTNLGRIAPGVTAESLEALLEILGGSMLAIATFAVASMVAAYSSAGSTATPRTFPLVIADDVSQNALSTFIGAFIFCIVALTALKNDDFEASGRVALFALTAFVFAAVVLTFVRWVDRIARLGRLGATIDNVEEATAAALRRRRAAPALHGVPASRSQPSGRPVYATRVGYVQSIDVPALQACAERAGGRVRVAALPGTFAVPGRPLAWVEDGIGGTETGGEVSGGTTGIDCDRIARSFVIGDDRRFDDDPRFGLVVLSEIAGRALSPAVNDPGTAIDIVGTLTRLFVLWSGSTPMEEPQSFECDRVEVPVLSERDMFDDAFTAIARDGAGAVEVAVRLQKALDALASLGDGAMREAALHHARLALTRAERAMDLPEDVALVRDSAAFARIV